MDYNTFIQKTLECAVSFPYADTIDDDTYSTYSIARLMCDKDIKEANEHLMYTASFAEYPILPKNDRANDGEVDFAGLACVIAINTVYDKLYPEVKARIKQFLTQENFESIYGSENHVFVTRVVRFLAAEFYGEDFPYYNMTNAEVLDIDKKYLLEFIAFRAKYGFGEFTSQYLGADIYFVSVLADYVKDKEVKRAAEMACDLIVIESFNNTDNGLNTAGALGRSYTGSLLSPHCCVGAGLKKIFYEKFHHVWADSELAIAPFYVDKFILDTFEHREMPFEVKERKSLHSMSAWRTNVPNHAQLNKLFDAGSINKYTYFCEGYGLGAINHQDEYPVDDTEDYVYAHHQQIEWSLTFPENEKQEATRIYSHHPGKTDQHNYWTGDLRCCCTRSFTTKDTALSIYDIEKEDEYDFTHMLIEPEKLDKYEEDGKYIFIERNGYYCVIYIDKPFELKHNDKYNVDEIISVGRKNAYALHIEKADGNFDAFKQRMKAVTVSLNEDTMTFTFGNITIDKHHDYIDGVENKYPYAYTYDMPWCKSVWGEGIITVNAPDGTYIMDFNKFEVTKK